VLLILPTLESAITAYSNFQITTSCQPIAEASTPTALTD
jgi:hypothetical protein